jgi:hypothetical protein
MTPLSPLLPEVHWDRLASLWRVTIGEEPISDDDGTPRGWVSFNAAYDVMLTLERAAWPEARWL